MKAKKELEAEINATIKYVMVQMEILASMPPEQAAEPMTFNDLRHKVIRRIWNVAKECLDYAPASMDIK